MADLTAAEQRIRRLLGDGRTVNPETIRTLTNLLNDIVRAEHALIDANPSFFPLHLDVLRMQELIAGSDYRIITTPAGTMLFVNTANGIALDPLRPGDLQGIARINTAHEFGITPAELEALRVNAGYFPHRYASFLAGLGMSYDPATGIWTTSSGQRFSISGPLEISIRPGDPHPIRVTPLPPPRRR